MRAAVQELSGAQTLAPSTASPSGLVGSGLGNLFPQSDRPRGPGGGCMAFEPQKSQSGISTGPYWGRGRELPKFKGRGH